VATEEYLDDYQYIAQLVPNVFVEVGMAPSDFIWFRILSFQKQKKLFLLVNTTQMR
jgi:hypothetical protein